MKDPVEAAMDEVENKTTLDFEVYRAIRDIEHFTQKVEGLVKSPDPAISKWAQASKNHLNQVRTHLNAVQNSFPRR